MDVPKIRTQANTRLWIRVLRVLGGEKPTANSAITIRLLTKDTAGTAFDDTSRKQGFEQLWSGAQQEL